MSGRRALCGTRVPVECLWENPDDVMAVTQHHNNSCYHERLNGYPLRRDTQFNTYPLPVLDPDVDAELRRRCIPVVAVDATDCSGPGRAR